ncbi:DUF2274 domain-containing protein [Sphingomonas koreensis]|uniref:DUF2274 domain-containing protein n=1 Tax=Sphingomonas koreensis TaxID=93064 RepID=UPI0028B072D9|nr:DUF2274 domain-containing protein [Sphingomonas koreensis]
MLDQVDSLPKSRAATYGVAEPVAELVPAMLQAFLESDRAFMRGQAARERGR